MSARDACVTTPDVGKTVWHTARPCERYAVKPTSGISARAAYDEGKNSGQQMPKNIAQQYEAEAEHAPDEAEVLRVFAVADTFGKHNGICLQYRVLSGHCHPSVTSRLAPHFRPDDESDVGMVLHTTAASGTMRGCSRWESPCCGQRAPSIDTSSTSHVRQHWPLWRTISAFLHGLNPVRRQRKRRPLSYIVLWLQPRMIVTLPR